MNPFISSIMIVASNGSIYGDSDNYMIFQRQFPNFDYKERLANNRFDRIITEPYKGRYGYRTSIIREILSPISLLPIGYIWVNLDYNKTQALFYDVLAVYYSNHFAIGTSTEKRTIA